MSDSALTARSSSHPPVQTVEPELLFRRYTLRATARRAVVFSLLMVAAVALQSPLIALFALFALRRLLWGTSRHHRAHQHHRMAARQRRMAFQVQQIPEDPNRRAVLALTGEADAPLYQRARERGLELVERLSELDMLLADAALNAALHQPLSERREDLQAELKALLSILGRATQDRRQELSQWLEAQAEVEAMAPAYIPAR